MLTPIDIPRRRVKLQINGTAVVRDVDCRKHLVDFLREDCGHTGSHLGCEHGVCGACTVRLDGDIVRGCLVLAVQADGGHVETVETAHPSSALEALQDAFIEHNALQCGYCTPGMLMAALELVERQPDATREQVRLGISGNYCRCTGYHAIVDAICTVLQQQRSGAFEATATATAAETP
ncbi:MAG: (2Fe-2S)-binding protein [Rubrivivax sp.]